MVLLYSPKCIYDLGVCNPGVFWYRGSLWFSGNFPNSSEVHQWLLCHQSWKYLSNLEFQMRLFVFFCHTQKLLSLNLIFETKNIIFLKAFRLYNGTKEFRIFRNVKYFCLQQCLKLCALHSGFIALQQTCFNQISYIVSLLYSQQQFSQTQLVYICSRCDKTLAVYVYGSHLIRQ